MIWEITEPLHLHKETAVLYGSFFIVHQPHSGKHSGKSGTNVTATSEHVIFLEVILTLTEGDRFHQRNSVMLKKDYFCVIFCFLLPFKGVCKRQEEFLWSEGFFLVLDENPLFKFGVAVGKLKK